MILLFQKLPDFLDGLHRADFVIDVHDRDQNRVVTEGLLQILSLIHIFHIEVREKIYLYSDVIPGLGGMPIGTNGKSMLLLSGGIDSPVAGYMVAKRGVKIDAVYFHAPPYTSERAKQKVVDLAEKVSRFTGPIYLYVVNFTDIQLYIYEKCPHDELTIIMRRYMMRIAERIAEKTGCLGPVSYTHLSSTRSRS